MNPVNRKRLLISVLALFLALVSGFIFYYLREYAQEPTITPELLEQEEPKDSDESPSEDSDESSPEDSDESPPEDSDESPLEDSDESPPEDSDESPPEDSDEFPPGVVGPGGCSSFQECEEYCSNPVNQEECLKFMRL